MNQSADTEALDAILQEVEKLLTKTLSSEVRQKLELINSIARHRVDVRSEQERADD